MDQPRRAGQGRRRFLPVLGDSRNDDAFLLIGKHSFGLADESLEGAGVERHGQSPHGFTSH